MISIPVAVEEVVKKKPFLEGALVDGLINLSALARQIKPEVEERIGKTVNDSAVIMALNRLVPRLELMSAMKIKNVVENMGDIVVRSNLSDFTFLNTSTLYGLQARLLNEVHSLKNVFCTFSQGIYETTLVVSDSIVPLVKELFANERIISSNTNLSLITVRLPSENTACPGVYYYLFKELAWDNINIVEVISTANEFTIVVGDHVESALGLIHFSRRAGHLDPTHFGMWRGQRLREPIQCECERAGLPRETRVAIEWFKIIVVEHLIGDDGHLMVMTKPHNGLTFRRFDVRSGRIVGIDEHQRADAAAIFTFKRFA